MDRGKPWNYQFIMWVRCCVAMLRLPDAKRGAVENRWRAWWERQLKAMQEERAAR